mgnify:CR=1 FL=1
MADLSPLLETQRNRSPRLVWWADKGSTWLPLVAAALSVTSGVEAMPGNNASVAAWCGIVGGLVSAASVWATNYSSRVRDGKLELAQASADLSQQTADLVAGRQPPTF